MLVDMPFLFKQGFCCRFLFEFELLFIFDVKLHMLLAIEFGSLVLFKLALPEFGDPSKYRLRG